MIRIVFFRRRSIGGFGVIHIDREGEDRVLGNILAFNSLRQKESGTPLVDRGERNDFFVDIVLAAFDGIGFGSVGRLMLIVCLDEHDRVAVDHHGMDGGDIQLPVEGNAGFAGLFHKGEIVAFGAGQRLAVLAHDADGDKDGIRPRGGRVVAGKDDVAYRLAVTRHRQGDRRLLAFVDLVVPFFRDREDLHRGSRYAIGIGEPYGFRFRIRDAGIRIGQGSGSVGLQVAVDIDVLLNDRIQVSPGAVFPGIVLDGRDIVEGRLTGIDVEGHGVGDFIQQGVDTGKVPIDRAVRQLRLGGIEVVQRVGFGPLILQAAGGNRAVHRNGLFGAAAVCPVDRAGSVAVVCYGVRDFVCFAVDTSEFAVHHGDGEPVLIGVLIHFQQLGDFTGAGGHLVGGAVLDGDRGDAQRLHDLVEDRGDRSLQRRSTAGVIVIRVRIVSFRRDGAPFLPVDGVVQKVVQQVGFVAVGVNAVEGAACPGDRVSNGKRLLQRGRIPGYKPAERSGRRVVWVRAVCPACSGRTVRDHNDEGRRVLPPAVDQVLSQLQRMLPVRAHAGVGEIGGVIGAAFREAVCHSGNIV